MMKMHFCLRLPLKMSLLSLGFFSKVLVKHSILALPRREPPTGQLPVARHAFHFHAVLPSIGVGVCTRALVRPQFALCPRCAN